MSERVRAQCCPGCDLQATHSEGAPSTPHGSHRSLAKQTREKKKEHKKAPKQNKMEKKIIKDFHR